jgi:hypothetical protein
MSPYIIPNAINRPAAEIFWVVVFTKGNLKGMSWIDRAENEVTCVRNREQRYRQKQDTAQTSIARLFNDGFYKRPIGFD